MDLPAPSLIDRFQESFHIFVVERIDSNNNDAILTHCVADRYGRRVLIFLPKDRSRSEPSRKSWVWEIPGTMLWCVAHWVDSSLPG